MQDELIAQEGIVRRYNLYMETGDNRQAIKTDLFSKPKSMREKVLNLCKEKGFVTSIDLAEFAEDIRHREGIVKGLLRIHREARELAQDKVIRRLDKEEKIFRGFSPKFAVYEFIK